MICGIDEAGRGPLAGPVCAAAVILPKDFPFEILNDSKKLKEKQREAARSLIIEKAFAWGIGWASFFEIDKINILKASLLAMKRAYEEMAEALKQGNGSAIESLTSIIDGLYAPDIPIPCTPMVKADAQIPEVMAASILAKTARDRLMGYYALFYPEYGYEKHKGYPTKSHREAVLTYGPSPIQRLTFKVKP
ncbi:ribonuclease HII [Leadbettera azotonutricia]|uniref:Ribonuclease HII n=1 Tax=Leadbettera azotonutricia (strain ATCC BAA-888 / DSM 13862 / ZAS-9) TaxID=545695 RepID=F5YE78_LEAAZ|nr:ribonuclease HII [Leadbettera azotonutricia]AEF82925.1 ribonuclease HII [Leadbettera azotonutricia ZAS-9]